MQDESQKRQTEPDKGGPGGRRPTRVGSGAMPPFQSVCCSCMKLVHEATPVLPYMGAYVCAWCAQQGRRRPVKESEIANKVIAPWAEHELAVLAEYQASEAFLPFICYEGHVLVARTDGLVCPHCPGFILHWTYQWVLNGNWKQEL